MYYWTASKVIIIEVGIELSPELNSAAVRIPNIIVID